MIHPTCLEILATVQSAFSRDIVPRLADVEGRSTAATIEHLLRHITLRIEQEGALLTIDIARLRNLLENAETWMRDVALDSGAVRHALAREAVSAAYGYRNLDRLAADALCLRAVLVDVQGLIAERNGDPAAQALHARIREYIGLQLADEATLIEPAFSGKGPRR